MRSQSHPIVAGHPCHGWARVIAGCLIGLCALVLGCDGGEHRNQPGETTLQRIRRTGVVRIAYANEAPYGYKDPQTGRVTGEAPEIATVILKKVGVDEIQATITDFGQLIPGLNAGRFDLIAAGMYITPERCKQIHFSNPTYAIGEAFLVKQGNPKALHSYEDVLTSGDAKIGVVGGTVELQIAEKAGIPDSRVVVFPDNAAALAGLKAGRIDAFAGTALTVQDLLAKSHDAGLERAEPFRQPQAHGRSKNYGAFGFRKEDGDLVAAFNEKLAPFIGSPQHLTLVEPFGFTARELPGDVTAQQICQGLDHPD